LGGLGVGKRKASGPSKEARSFIEEEEAMPSYSNKL